MSTRPLRALVVDDEPVARRRLVRMLLRMGDVEPVGEAGDGAVALERIRALAPDVVLLDIRMPGIDGMTLATRDEPLPPIVFTTAYEEHAVQAFEAAAVDYLLKPVSEERLREALERVRSRLRSDDSRRLAPLLQDLLSEARPPRIAARRGTMTRLFDAREIARFRARDKYTSFLHSGEGFLIDDSLASLEQRLAPWGFLLVHRAELINLACVKALRDTGRGWVAELSDGQTVAVSRRRIHTLEERLGLAR
jgi:DNA-binding LytR/AlgR family response regulator